MNFGKDRNSSVGIDRIKRRTGAGTWLILVGTVHSLNESLKKLTASFIMTQIRINHEQFDDVHPGPGHCTDSQASQYVQLQNLVENPARIMRGQDQTSVYSQHEKMTKSTWLFKRNR